MKVFEETEDSVSGLFSKSLQELEDRAEKGSKKLEEQQKKEQEFVAEVYESYMTPREMLELPDGEFFFIHNFFMKNAGDFMKTFSWRYGQCFFNILRDHNGRVAELLRGSIRDPFNKDKVSDELWDFVMDHWEAK